MELVWLSLLSLWSLFGACVDQIAPCHNAFSCWILLLQETPWPSLARLFLLAAARQVGPFDQPWLLAKRRIMERAIGKTMRLCGGNRKKNRHPTWSV